MPWAGQRLARGWRKAATGLRAPDVDATTISRLTVRQIVAAVGRRGSWGRGRRLGNTATLEREESSGAPSTCGQAVRAHMHAAVREMRGGYVGGDGARFCKAKELRYVDTDR